jgi:DNA-binding response OmpR family regulator
MTDRPGQLDGGRPHLRLVRNSLRVLVAEDDAEMRRMVIQALRLDGYQVIEAEDGEELLSLLLANDSTQHAPIDLIVSDVRMPGISGVDMLETLRAADDSTPVILMTAFPDDLMRRRADNLHAMLFDKPFELGDLRVAVAALLHSRVGT